MNSTVLNRSRSDKFLLVLDLPEALKKKTNKLDSELPVKADTLQFTVFGSPVPKVEIKHHNVPFGGQHHNVTSGARTDHGGLTLKFLIDNAYQNYWVMWQWLNLFNDINNSNTDLTQVVSEPWQTPLVLADPFSDYVADFVLYGLDEYNNKIISFNYSRCFITSLSEINFSHQDPSEITCVASFAYNRLFVKMESVDNKIL